MPNYSYTNEKTGEEETLTMSISEMEEFEKNNPHMSRIFGSMTVVDPVIAGVTKPPVDFQKFVLGKVKAKNPHNEIRDRRWTIPKEI